MQHGRVTMLRVCRYSAAVSAGLLNLAAGLAGAAPPQPHLRQLTLEQALQQALARSPVLRAERARVDQSRGRLLTARTYPFNPEISMDAAHRRSQFDTMTDRNISVSQEIEMGGKRRRRVKQAAAEQDATLARVLRAERLLTARVRAAFTETIRSRELVEINRANADLAASLANVAQKRFNAGAATQMEVNLALVQVGRAQRDLRLSEGGYQVARTMLAEVVGLDPATLPVPAGKLDLQGGPMPPYPQLVASALSHRADLKAFRDTVRASRARVEVARRQIVPNLVTGVFYGREEGLDNLVGGFVSARIPILNRNRGAIVEANGLLLQSQAEEKTLELQVRQEVASALALYKAAVEATTNLKLQVMGSLEDNLALLQRSFEAGKTSWTEVLVFRREFVDVRREFVETITEARLAGIEMDLAAGATPAAPTREETRP
ncbi:MAG: TolC family protein [Acidobacteriota bacterium]